MSDTVFWQHKKRQTFFSLYFVTEESLHFWSHHEIPAFFIPISAHLEQKYFGSI
jgi:hypothetical protein